MRRKKAQVWFPDFIFAFLLFVLALTMSIKFITNTFPDSGYAALLEDSERISETFMSQGAPINWTNETVIKIGLLTDKKFDPNKMNNLTNMTYSVVRDRLTTRYDFFMFIKDPVAPHNISHSFGHPAVSIIDNSTVVISALEYDNLVKIDRFITINDSIGILAVYIWD